MLSIIVAMALAPPVAENGSRTAPGVVVRQFVAAYNQRDFSAFQALLKIDANWYSVAGGAISADGTGRAAIVDWTKTYLEKTCRSCKSEIVSLGIAGAFVSTVERASWKDASGVCRVQSSVGVYEVKDAAIKAVWYFPSSPKDTC